MLVVIYTYRKASIRIISATPRRAAGDQAIRGKPMKREYDFSKGKRGRIVVPEPEQRGKTRITIRLDEDLVDHF